MTRAAQEVRIQGSPICEGIAIGLPFFFSLEEDAVPEFSVAIHEIDDEILRYQQALIHCKRDIEKLQQQLSVEHVFDALPILDTYLQIIQDPLITTHIEDQLRQKQKNAEFIFQSAINEYEERFNKITNAFFRERFKDIQDISRRIMNYLKQTVRVSLASVPMHSIVFSREIVPSDIAEAKKSRVAAFITEVGGETSHSAIIAKAKGIPYISNIDFQNVYKYRNQPVIVDGKSGLLIVCPTAKTIAQYQKLQTQFQKYYVDLSKAALQKTETLDGHTLSLVANIEMLDEVEDVHKHHGQGVGLFRSEYLFLSKKRFPSEEEQYQAYCELAKNMLQLPVVIRTFDIGGDKFTEHNPYVWQEANPFLGCRAIRLMLKNRDIFKQQLRAILRASVLGNISILFPLISGVTELRQAKDVLLLAQKELQEEGLAFDSSIKVGCMIELPSAALVSDLLAKECDFFSIGTNDLVQYAVGVDRGNQNMSYLYTPAHPSVIRLIKTVVSEANKNNIPVSVCGEIAADPDYTALLVGLGVRGFSVAPRYLPLIKQSIRSITLDHAAQLAENVLAATTAEEILLLLQQNAMQKNQSPC